MTEEQSKKVFNALREKILGGEYASRFPSERSLMRQFGVTRTGIRTVLSKLEAQHIITRRRGSGTYLAERAQNRASGILGIIIPDAKSPFYAAMIEGITKGVKNSGGGVNIRYLSPILVRTRQFRAPSNFAPSFALKSV